MKRSRFKELREMLVTALKYDELYKDLRDVKIDLVTSPFGTSRVIPPKMKLPLSHAILLWLAYPSYVAYFTMPLLMPSLSSVPQIFFFLFGFFILFNLTFYDPRIRGKENVFTLVMPTKSLLCLVCPVELSLLHELQHIRQVVKGLPISECEARKMARKLLPVFYEKLRQDQALKA